MAALTANAVRLTRGTPKYGTAAVADGSTIYVGAIVMWDASAGRAIPGADSAGDHVLGIAVGAPHQDGVSVTGNSGGTELVRFAYGHEAFIAANAALTAAFTGLDAVVEDDNQLTTAADATNDVRFGRVVEHTSSGVWAEVANFSGEVA